MSRLATKILPNLNSRDTRHLFLLLLPGILTLNSLFP